MTRCGCADQRDLKICFGIYFSSPTTMATLLPPPKRQKIYHGVQEPENDAPEPTPSIVVQFVSEDDGRHLAPAVNIPANVSREGLEALVNRLSKQVYCGLSNKLPLLFIHPLTNRFNSFIIRTKSLCHSHSMSSCLEIKMRQLVLQHKS